MGQLVNGIWKDEWYDTKSSDGEFIRKDSQFRGWITADGSPAEGTREWYPAEKDRYQLYISLACPWAHRTLIFRKLKQLEEIIPVTVVKAEMLENGWEFGDYAKADDVAKFDLKYLYDLYKLANETYTGRITVPVLWDKKNKTIINNESSEIIRMFNSSFNEFTTDRFEYYPDAQREEIDEINNYIYHNINNGVYRCGFATTQAAYESAFKNLFDALNELEKRLSSRRYLLGSNQTEADWRLFTTLIRFDVVYFGHFKTNQQRIADYPNLSNYVRDLYQQPGISETVNLEHIKTHYYYSHETINPTRIIPKGPYNDFKQPHDRYRFQP